MTGDADYVYSDSSDRLCSIYGCEQPVSEDSFYCAVHKGGPKKGERNEFSTAEPERLESVYDHIKINIEQSAKGARVTVTYDRSDHDIEVAVMDAILIYETTIKNLKDQGLKVDE